MSVSCNFREITEAEAIANPFSDAWRDASIPAQQFELVKAELKYWKAGGSMPLFDTLIKALPVCLERRSAVLEIGCGVGHYSAVIHHAGTYDYTGIDYNPYAINIAAEMWPRPHTRFKIANALSLPYPAYSFDVVISSTVLLHLINWQAALTQAAFVTRSHLILHRTPISRRRTRYFVKRAYGVDCLEIHFAEHDLFEQIDLAGFEYTNSWVTSEDLEHQYKTYLLTRKTVFHHPV